MTLVKRSVKGTPISASEYDDVVDQVESNKTSVEYLNGQFLDSEVTLSFADLAAATSYWTAQDGASNTPNDDVEIYIAALNQFYKWNAADVDKAVFSRNEIVKATTIEAGNDNYASSGQVYDALGLKTTLNNSIISWATTESFTISNPTYNNNGLLITADIKWSDADEGTISNVTIGDFGYTSIRYNRSNGDYVTTSISYDSEGNPTQTVTLTQI